MSTASQMSPAQVGKELNGGRVGQGLQEQWVA